jgi:hypothetical protein
MVRLQMDCSEYSAEPGAGGDGPQRTLFAARTSGGCGPRLSLGVDMTSEVKSWPRIFDLFFLPFAVVIGRDGARKTRRLILRLAVG